MKEIPNPTLKQAKALAQEDMVDAALTLTQCDYGRKKGPTSTGWGITSKEYEELEEVDLRIAQVYVDPILGEL